MVLWISFINIPNDPTLTKGSEGEKGLTWRTIPGCSIIVGGVEAGVSKGGDTSTVRAEGVNVAGLTHAGQLSFSIHTAQDPCLENGATHGGLGLPTSVNLVKTSPYRHACSLNQCRQSLSETSQALLGGIT